MLDFGFYCMDCMDGMKEFPDGYFDLAIVDPPYGINVTGRHKVKSGTVLVGGAVELSAVHGGFGNGRPQPNRMGGVTMVQVQGTDRRSKCRQNFIPRSMIARHRTQTFSQS